MTVDVKGDGSVDSATVVRVMSRFVKQQCRLLQWPE
jgi:hypothetical protein